jgi:hypothetical protein
MTNIVSANRRSQRPRLPVNSPIAAFLGNRQVGTSHRASGAVGRKSLASTQFDAAEPSSTFVAHNIAFRMPDLSHLHPGTNR